MTRVTDAIEDTHPGPSDDPPVDRAGGARRSLDPLAATDRQRTVLLRIVRGGYVVLLLTVTLLNIIGIAAEDDVSQGPSRFLALRWWLPIGAVMVAGALFLAADILTPNKKLQTVGGIVVGLIAGLVATAALSFVVELVAASWDFADSNILAAIQVILGISLCYLGVSTVLQTQDDFRLSIPYVEFAKQIRGAQPLVLDTSALIDARIADVAAVGFIQAPIVIPAFVIGELHQLADSGDKLKRAKGRRGLDVVSRLQRSAGLDLTIDESSVVGKAVDQMIVELARRMPGVVVTTDIALSRTAGFKGVPVLNLNELANALKATFVSGDAFTLTLIKTGEHDGQGVGYLDDGTMVIAEDGGDRIGEEVELVVRSTLQTQAGRMVFARLADHRATPSSANAGHGSVESTDASPDESATTPKDPRPPREPVVNPRRNPRR